MNKILYHPKPGTTGFFYGDFPDKPERIDIFSKVGTDTFNKYEKDLRLAKEEAIKNGEIVNSEEIERKLYQTDKRITGPFNFDAWKRIILKDGDLFDLPEGVTVEKICKKCNSYGEDLTFSQNICCSTANCIAVRLVPIKEEKKPVKEESQESLIGEIWYRWFGKDEMSNAKCNEIMEEFTIQRKTK